MYTTSGKISSGKQLASQDETALQIHAFTGSGKVSSGKQLTSQDDTVLQIHALTPQFILTYGRKYPHPSLADFDKEFLK